MLLEIIEFSKVLENNLQKLVAFLFVISKYLEI